MPSSVWDTAYLGPSTALTKQRRYNMGYEMVFKAAYQATRNTGLYVAKLDKEIHEEVVQLFELLSGRMCLAFQFIIE